MTKPKTTEKPTTKSLDIFVGKWLIGSVHALHVTHKTAKSVTLEHGGVSMGKHFGVMHEHKPS